jgi:hypothetical protein
MNFGTFGLPFGLGLNNGLFSLPTQKVLWTPANTTTSLWLDSADTSTITIISGAISQWNDKSGNSRNATQSTSTKRPIVVNSALNGLNGISFDGIDDYLEILGYLAVNSAASNNTVIIVCESSGTTRYGLLGTRRTAVSEGWVFSYFSSTANPLLALIGGINNASATGRSRAADILLFEKTPTTINVNSFLNTSSLKVSNVLNPVTTSISTKIGVEDDILSSPLLGKIYEIIVLPFIDIAIRQKIEGYLAYKWGLINNLPVDHPHKYLPPIL